MRVGLVAAAICLSIVGLAAADGAKAAIRKDTSIPAGGLGPALQTLAKQYDFQVLYRTEVVGALRTEGVVGQLTSEEALKQLLKGTGLTYRYLDEKTITVMPASTGSGGAASAPAQPSTSPPSTSTNSQQEGKTDSSGAFLLAQAASGQTASTSPVDTQKKRSEQSEVPLQEVIVTAQKRTERLQDVPVPVTAISADTLLSRNELRLQDYFATVPSLNMTTSATLVQILTIRGINSGGGNPTVGITIDDVPFGSSTGFGGAGYIPDIDPNDLARVEVLRGPQGTLYGADSIGGLIKFVTVDPSTEGFGGRVQVGTSSTRNGAGLGYDARASVNIPVTDDFALRASAFTRQDPGYIDNPILGVNGINEDHVSGGRLSALWRPTEAVSLKLSALYQDFKGDGSNEVSATLGDLQQNFLRGTGGSESKVQAYSAILNAKLGTAELTSLTGYNVNQFSVTSDLTAGFGPIGNSGTLHDRVSKFTQEVRLTTPIGQSINWLLGGFYSHENSPYVDTVSAADPTTGALGAQFVNFDTDDTVEELAAFTDLTWRLTDRFDIQIGGRESQIRETYDSTTTGPYDLLFLGLPSPVVAPTGRARRNAFTYLVTPRLKLSSDLMVYARLASGYRAGGPNVIAPSVPSQFDPDKTLNYELGVKGSFLEHKLSVDASVYYIDWKDLQLDLLSPSFTTYTTNAGRARSSGAELSAELRPLNGLTISGWVAWDDAVLREGLPATGLYYGPSGTRLPDTSRFSGTLDILEEFPMNGTLTGFVDASGSYVGNRLGPFASAFDPQLLRQTFPAYAKLDLRAGVRIDSWTVNLFATNLADKRGVLAGGVGYFPPATFVYIHPRTIGLSLSKAF